MEKFLNIFMESLVRLVAMIFAFVWITSFVLELIIFKFLLNYYLPNYGGWYYILWTPLLGAASFFSVLLVFKVITWFKK